jgi:hypothetical protein
MTPEVAKTLSLLKHVSTNTHLICRERKRDLIKLKRRYMVLMLLLYLKAGNKLIQIKCNALSTKARFCQTLHHHGCLACELMINYLIHNKATAARHITI